MSMILSSHIARILVALVLFVIGIVALGPHAQALSIDVSLNVLYDDPSDVDSGGTWQIVAKSSEDTFGISSLDLLLTGISSATAQPAGPRGQVNGADPAGFSIFSPYSPPFQGVTGLVMAQKPVAHALGETQEQSLFFGVGTLTDGTPNYPDKPEGSNFIGPAFTTLINVTGVPWATGDVFLDPAWDKAALLATGSFAEDITPAFYDDVTNTFENNGSAFTDLNALDGKGAPALLETIGTIVRTNFNPSAGNAADYNHNGIVDLPDYNVWADTFGATTGTLDADGTGDGVVNDADYEFWKSHYGMLVNPPTGNQGDYNGNGRVDTPDYAVWRDTLGGMGQNLPADGTGDGKVDDADYVLWKTNFGLIVPGSGSGSGQPEATNGAPAASGGAVPEPSTSGLLMGGICMLFLRLGKRFLRNVKLS